MRSRLAFASLLALLVACTKPATPSAAPANAPSPQSADVVGLWRATLELPGGEAPFGLAVERGADRRLKAYLINGPERVSVTHITEGANQLELVMPGFQNKLKATLDGDRLDGEVVMVRLRGELQRIPLHAQRNVTYRFFRSPLMDNARIGGRWSAVFRGSDGKPYPAVGEFTQQGASVTGTFLTPTGDHRYLAGEIRGQELYLSAFDGGHAFLYRARLDNAGRLEGTFWSGLHSRETFVAERNDTATLGKADQITQLKKPGARLEFRFPDLDGNMVSLTDERFRGKAVIVALAGSWCPNCHDEAAFLAPFYRQWRERGLEVVALMFERFGDLPQATAAARAFRQEFGIEYPTLIAGISDKDDAAAKLPALNGVFAFPTTLFVGRDGRVRSIHTGFSGPATGAHYIELQRDFAALVEQLLSEPQR